MKVVYRDTVRRTRRSLSFTVSGVLHSSVLAWVILGGTGQSQERAKSIYDLEIRPNEKKIVWYSLREKLPEITRSNRPDERQPPTPPRARAKALQTMVAGARDAERPAALIWAPEPEVAAPKAAPLPNVVKVAAPKVVRPFVAPEKRSLTVAAPIDVPDAPRVAADVKTEVALPVAAPEGPRRGFTQPPRVRMERQAKLQLPEAPQPEDVKHRSGPQLGTPVATLIGNRTMPAPAPVISAEPPAAAGLPAATAEASLAIVGLNPAKTTEIPAPPVSRPAAFSGGPERRTEGSAGANSDARVVVPGLVVQDGFKDKQPTLMANLSPTSRENLQAAARFARGAPSNAGAAPGATRAIPPDPRFAGRAVYTMAIQMPNVTSFSGSWLVWFAERDLDPKSMPGPAPHRMRAPQVVRKVDPKYVAAAVAERVEGTIRLFAVIGKDGHVGGIEMLRQLDERLDRSAQEALGKWEFVPAQVDGVAVDVEAIFEIPFHLAPRPRQ